LGPLSALPSLTTKKAKPSKLSKTRSVTFSGIRSCRLRGGVATALQGSKFSKVVCVCLLLPSGFNGNDVVLVFPSK